MTKTEQGSVGPTARATRFRVLFAPERFTTQNEVPSQPSPMPTAPGVDASRFDTPPFGVPVDSTHQTKRGYLLYVGISSKELARNGRPLSKQNPRTHFRYQDRSNAAGSTLRLTLGCLLADELGIQLRRVGSGGRFTFSAGEAIRSERAADHARVYWFVDSDPRLIESKVISELELPHNFDQNKNSGFLHELSGVRRAQHESALRLPTVQ